MNKIHSVISRVVDLAIDEARAQSVSVYTFALYYDHESHAMSVCIDTKEQSHRTVASMNQFNRRYFDKAVSAGDLSTASLWQANVGRSLSLGDFHMVNVARKDLSRRVKPDAQFFTLMIQCLSAAEHRILALAEEPTSLLFCCSGAEDEVAYCWAPSAGEANNDPA